MNDLIKWALKLWEILKDGKVAKEELPEFLTAVAGLVSAIVALVLPFIRGDAATVAKRLAAGMNLAAGK